MRIWAFPSFYPYDKPGLAYGGIFAHRQYKGLIQNGADLKVIVPVLWGPGYPFSLLHSEWKQLQKIGYPDQRVYDGITVYHPRIANNKPSRFVKKTYTERFVDSIVGFFNKQGINLSPSTDIFYSQWLPGSALVQLAAHKLGVKSAILSIGDDVVQWPHGNEYNFNSFKKTLTEADMRFSCAQYLGKLANKTINADLPFDVVGWGVDYDSFKPVSQTEKNTLRNEYNIAGNKVVILMIGTAVARKGWLDLFDALQEIKKSTPDFLLLGVHTAAPDFDFTEETDKRGISGHFLNLGAIAPQSLYKTYNMADIFCLPSHSEGMANVVIEAMSSGLPVITTNVGGHPEIISSGSNGILVEPMQPGILAEQLLELISDKNKREIIGANAREYIVKEWGNFADNAKILYEKFNAL